MPYLRNRWFLIFCAFYLLNRGLVQPCISVSYPWIANCLRDVLVVPCLTTVVLSAFRMVGFKSTYNHPTAFELAIGWVFFSVLLEFVLPIIFGLGVSDPFDVLWYATGTVLAMLVWRPKGCHDRDDNPPKHSIGYF